MYHLFPSYQLKSVIACVFMRKDGPGSEKHYTAIFRRYLLLKQINFALLSEYIRETYRLYRDARKQHTDASLRRRRSKPAI